MSVHGHEVIIAGTRAEVTPRHDFVMRVAEGAQLAGLRCRRRAQGGSKRNSQLEVIAWSERSERSNQHRH